MVTFIEVSKSTQSITITLHTEKKINRNKAKLTSFAFLVRQLVSNASSSDQNGLVRRSRTALFIYVFSSRSSIFSILALMSPVHLSIETRDLLSKTSPDNK